MPMIRNARKSISLLLATLLPFAVLAQDELLDEGQVEIKHYSVELIVFTYEENVSVGSEVFPPEVIELGPEELFFVEEIDVVVLARRHPDFIGLDPVMLSDDELTLHEVFEHLERLDAYNPVLHVGWTQPGYPQNDTVKLPLAGFVAPPEGFDGSFALYLGRYLHLIVDLTLTPPVAAAEYLDEDGAVQEYEYELAPLDGPIRYYLQEDRIVKNGEMRYFDHPKFGVIALVNRVLEEPPAVVPPLVRQTAQ